MQLVNFPDVDSPSNQILSLYKADYGFKLLISKQQSFVSQYQINEDATVKWLNGLTNGIMNTSVGLAFENTVRQGTYTVKFRITFWDIMKGYQDYFFSDMSFVAVVVLYFIFLYGLLRFVFKKKKLFDFIDKREEDFIEYYHSIMDSDELKKNLMISEVS